MKQLFPILLLVCSASSHGWQLPQSSASQPTQQATSPSAGPPSTPAIPVDKQNADKAKDIINQAIKALGGETFLSIRDREQ